MNPRNIGNNDPGHGIVFYKVKIFNGIHHPDCSLVDLVAIDFQSWTLLSQLITNHFGKELPKKFRKYHFSALRCQAFHTY